MQAMLAQVSYTLMVALAPIDCPAYLIQTTIAYLPVPTRLKMLCKKLLFHTYICFETQLNTIGGLFSSLCAYIILLILQRLNNYQTNLSQTSVDLQHV